MAATVIEALRRFLPDLLQEDPCLSTAQRRAIWAITHCRTPTMGGHLHTWNQRLLFHPHLHAIVPGAGLDQRDQVVRVHRASYLAPKAVLRTAFRQRFKQGLDQLTSTHDLPALDPRVWHRDWGVKLQPFGDGQNAIKYLGAYVARTAIGDSRIRSITDTQVTFSWKDRAHGGLVKTDTLSGVEFVRRYLRHVLPAGLKAVRHYGFCHPAAKAQRERIAFHTGLPLRVGATVAERTPLLTPSLAVPTCPCCGQPMKCVLRVPPTWARPRAPPPQTTIIARIA